MKGFLVFLLISPQFSIQQYDNLYDSETQSQMDNYCHHHHGNDYQDGYYRSSSRRRKKKHGGSGGGIPSTYEEDATSCECVCQLCDPRPCCKPVCSCEPEPPPDIEYQNGGTNVVFVPYPLHFIVPGSGLAVLTTEPPTTTPEPTTTLKPTPNAKAEPITTTAQKTTKNLQRTSILYETLKKRLNIEELLELVENNANLRRGASNHDRYEYIRPTKSDVFPKYGIVPLPDPPLKFLISRVRNVKDLQSYS